MDSSILLKDVWSWENNITTPVGNDPPDNLLVTFLTNREKIEQLKHGVTTQSKNDDEHAAGIRFTSFVVTCAFMWVNLMKLQEKTRGGGLDDHDDDILYYLAFVADCRERFGLSIPVTYFGNCLAPYYVSAKRRELMEENGIAVAAKVIAGRICELGKGVLVGAKTWVSDGEKAVKDGRLVSVAGSPKFHAYETDFGWGRPKKSDMVHIGAYGSFSINESREEAGGVQIGVIVERDKLDVFNAIFQP